MNSTQNAQIKAYRFAQYIDHNGDPQIILVSSTETEETLQRHFESTVGKRLEIVGFYWDIDMHTNPTRYPIGTLDDAQESVIKLASENAKLRAKAEKYDLLIKDLAVEMRDPNGTIWDEANRLKAEIDELVRCLWLIRDNPDQGGYWCAEQATWTLNFLNTNDHHQHISRSGNNRVHPG